MNDWFHQTKFERQTFAYPFTYYTLWALWCQRDNIFLIKISNFEDYLNLKKQEEEKRTYQIFYIG